MDKELQTEEVVEKKEDVVDKQSEKPEGGEPQYTEEETLALTRGWKPKEEWEGDPDEWKPAKVFNEIGELKEKVSSSEKELKKSNKVIALMKEHHLKVRQSALKEAIETLKKERQAALKDQDFAKAEEIRDQIDDVKENFENDESLPRHVEQKLKEEGQVGEPDPEFYAFVNRNPWYKPNGGNEMSKKADALGWAYKNENPEATFKDIIKKVETDIRKLYPEKFNAPKTAVNEPGSRASNDSPKGKVKLSESEREVAKSFGMTDEEYAKELESYRGR